MSELVLSLFPGIDLLGRAFEDEGYTVVRGPDPLWGGDIKTFSPPAGRFEGVIGGPPCQIHSRLRHLNPLAGQKHGDLIPEFCRVVGEAQPDWFLMENVREAPLPAVPGYVVRDLLLNNKWLGAEQHRVRRFSLGTRDGRALDVSPDLLIFEEPRWREEGQAAYVGGGGAPVPVKLGGSGKVKRTWKPAGEAAPARTAADLCRLQGLPEGFADELPFTVQGKRTVIGNGVPLPMGGAVARAVRRATARAAQCDGCGDTTNDPSDLAGDGDWAAGSDGLYWCPDCLRYREARGGA